MTRKEKMEILIDAVAVLIGEGYSNNQKYASVLVVKALLPSRISNDILKGDGIYPFKRNDPRVIQWAKEVKSIGKCEKCGSTENLEAHHIISWANYPKGRLDVDNGECLCISCHAKEHEGERISHMMKAKERRCLCANT